MMGTHRVRALLMGDQACVSYGAAEFSRDVDFAILTSPANLGAPRNTLKALAAEPRSVDRSDDITRCNGTSSLSN